MSDYYTEEEMYRLWVRYLRNNDDNYERVKILSELTAVNMNKALYLDRIFSEKFNNIGIINREYNLKHISRGVVLYNSFYFFDKLR